MNARFALPLFVALSATLGVTGSRAGEITFDTADGYNPFTSLSGQTQNDGSSWAGAGNIFAVDPIDVSDPFSGNNVAQSFDGDGPFSNVRFSPSTSFLGTTSTVIAGDEVFDYSLQIRSDSSPASADFASSRIIKLFDDGEDGAAWRITLFDNGRIQVPQPVGAEAVVLDSGGNILNLDDRLGEFIDISGVIDFSTETFTLTVDGVVQTTSGGSTTFDFFIPGQDDFGIVTLQRGNSEKDPLRVVSLDNIVLNNQAAPLVGDYNNDGSVDAADYIAWRQATVSGTPLLNETVTPGVANLADYVAWAGNYGDGSANAAAIPEPSAAVLLLTVVAFASRRV